MADMLFITVNLRDAAIRKERYFADGAFDVFRVNLRRGTVA